MSLRIGLALRLVASTGIKLRCQPFSVQHGVKQANSTYHVDMQWTQGRWIGSGARHQRAIKGQPNLPSQLILINQPVIAPQSQYTSLNPRTKPKPNRVTQSPSRTPFRNRKCSHPLSSLPPFFSSRLSSRRPWPASPEKPSASPGLKWTRSWCATLSVASSSPASAGGVAALSTMNWASQERFVSAKRSTGKGKLLPREYGLPLICPSSRFRTEESEEKRAT